MFILIHLNGPHLSRLQGLSEVIDIHELLLFKLLVGRRQHSSRLGSTLRLQHHYLLREMVALRTAPLVHGKGSSLSALRLLLTEDVLNPSEHLLGLNSLQVVGLRTRGRMGWNGTCGSHVLVH